MTAEEADLFYWLLARATGLAAFVALFIALVSGLALRTAVLDWLGTNRALRSLHATATALWLPLGAVHVVSLLADRTARVAAVDIVVPFGVDYGSGAGRLAIGLGTVALDVLVIVAITTWLRRGLDHRLWSWIHRTSYLAFGFTFAHAVLAGSDFSSPLVSALTWSLAFAAAVLASARIIWGRLPS